MIVQVHQSTPGIGTGLPCPYIVGLGHEVLAGDAVLMSGLDGGRRSIVGEPPAHRYVPYNT